MSHRSQHLRKATQRRNDIASITVGIILFAVFAVWIFRYVHHYSGWNRADGKVLDTRVTLWYASGATQAHAGVFHYRADALVSFSVRGKTQTEWLPTTTVDTDSNILAVRLSNRKRDDALVRWDPDAPDHGLVTLNLQ